MSPPASDRQPGVYIETPRLVESTTTVSSMPIGYAGFVGYARPRAGAISWPLLVGSLQEFDDQLETPSWGFLRTAVRGFFENGGQRVYISGVREGEPLSPDVVLGNNIPGKRSGLWAFDEAGDVELIAVPDLVAAPPGVPVDQAMVVSSQQQILSFCAGGGPSGGVWSQGGYFAVLDLPQGMDMEEAGEHRAAVAPEPALDGAFGAFFHPWVAIETLAGDARLVPPSGHVAGGFSRNATPGPSYPPGTITIDAGPHHTPANQPVAGVLAPQEPLGRMEAGRWLGVGVNCLIPWPARGTVIWGARTACLDKPNDQISVRRVLSYLERSMVRGTQWAMFENNEPKLWKQIRGNLEIFLEELWKKGMLVGGSPAEAFIVKCDGEINPPDSRDEGILNVDVWVRPVRPIEMIVLRIVHRTAEDQ